MLEIGRRTLQKFCKKAYGRISMLTKLKYVGVGIEDLIDIYSLFVRSCAEYCSVVFHSSLTNEQSRKLENIQKTSLKIILSDNYVNYQAACEMTGLISLAERRQNRMSSFAKKCISHPENSRFFPLNEHLFQDRQIRDRKKYKVNFAHGEKYRESAITMCQRLLNPILDTRISVFRPAP